MASSSSEEHVFTHRMSLLTRSTLIHLVHRAVRVLVFCAVRVLVFRAVRVLVFRAVRVTYFVQSEESPRHTYTYGSYGSSARVPTRKVLDIHIHTDEESARHTHLVPCILAEDASSARLVSIAHALRNAEPGDAEPVGDAMDPQWSFGS